MIFTHRVKGKVVNSFILRGLLFSIGSNIEICVTESEVGFVKDKLTDVDIVVLNGNKNDDSATKPLNGSTINDNELTSTKSTNTEKRYIKPTNKPTKT